MPDGRDPIAVKVVSRLKDIAAAEWDACAGDGDPFLSHAFLSILEESGSATAETGWLPQHLAIEDPTGRLVAAAPLYLKNHSYGEYVFDWGWADAYERAGGSYYPKLQCSVPFTPVTGPRLLLRPGVDREGLEAALMAAMVELARQHKVSSLHVTFPTRREYEAFGTAGFLQRIGQQYHWLNEGYDSFEAFLARLTSRKRKAIKKERRKVAESGVEVKVLTGDAIEERHWDAFYRFYLATIDKKWSQAYLTREFFFGIGEQMPERIALVVAEDDGRTVAGALNLIGADTLFGRNWGCLGHYRFLHFEACYYQAIDFAIERGLARVEAGAQGAHKVQRGYQPMQTYSAHWIADPRLRSAVEHFLQRERDAVDYEIDVLSERGPFKRTE